MLAFLPSPSHFPLPHFFLLPEVPIPSKLLILQSLCQTLLSREPKEDTFPLYYSSSHEWQCEILSSFLTLQLVLFNRFFFLLAQDQARSPKSLSLDQNQGVNRATSHSFLASYSFWWLPAFLALWPHHSQLYLWNHFLLSPYKDSGNCSQDSLR